MTATLPRPFLPALRRVSREPHDDSYTALSFAGREVTGRRIQKQTQNQSRIRLANRGGNNACAEGRLPLR